MTAKRTICTQHTFEGAFSPPVVGSRTTSPWCSITVETGGSPAVAGAGDVLDLTLDATSEAQEATLYWGDIEGLDIDLIDYIDFVVAATTLGSGVSAVIGLAGARNAAYDSIAQNAWFRCAASSTVVVESDDGTNDNDDKSTGGLTLGTTPKLFRIDFSKGTSDVRFYMDNGDGRLRRVAASTTFDMSNFTGLLQPYVSVNKSTGTGAAELNVYEIEIARRIN